jgi:hypothetical protein
VGSESEARQEMVERSIISGHGRRFKVERRSESERREMKLRIARVAAEATSLAVATVGLVIGMTAGTSLRLSPWLQRREGEVETLRSREKKC